MRGSYCDLLVVCLRIGFCLLGLEGSFVWSDGFQKASTYVGVSFYIAPLTLHIRYFVLDFSNFKFSRPLKAILQKWENITE